MATRRLYHDDSYVTRFRARVVAAAERAGRPAVELDATHFYPEAGGQLGDRGTLGGRRVADVQADDDGRVWHLLEDGPAPAGEVLTAIGYMIVFGLGTVPMMLTIALAGTAIQGPLRHKLQKAIPIGLACVAVLLILRGLSLGIPYVSPDLTGADGSPLQCH